MLEDKRQKTKDKRGCSIAHVLLMFPQLLNCFCFAASCGKVVQLLNCSPLKCFAASCTFYGFWCTTVRRRWQAGPQGATMNLKNIFTTDYNEGLLLTRISTFVSDYFNHLFVFHVFGSTDRCSVGMMRQASLSKSSSAKFLTLDSKLWIALFCFRKFKWG